MYEDEDFDDEPTCDSCGGPLYTQSHWKYYRCDDCGRTYNKDEDDD